MLSCIPIKVKLIWVKSLYILPHDEKRVVMYIQITRMTSARSQFDWMVPRFEIGLVGRNLEKPRITLIDGNIKQPKRGSAEQWTKSAPPPDIEAKLRENNHPKTAPKSAKITWETRIESETVPFLVNGIRLATANTHTSYTSARRLSKSVKTRHRYNP